MAQETGIGRRMADYYFEIESPNGEKTIFDSTAAQEDEEKDEESE